MRLGMRTRPVGMLFHSPAPLPLPAELRGIADDRNGISRESDRLALGRIVLFNDERVRDV